MKNEKVRNIIILVVVAIAFGAIGYFLPHNVLHHKGKRNITRSTNSTKKLAGKAKKPVFIHEEGSISSITKNTLNVNGTNIIVAKGTKIYSGSNLVNISTLKSGVTISVVGAHTKKGIVARFIIVM
jgi:hypothetical protein